MESTQTNGLSMKSNISLTDFVWPSNAGSPPGKPEKKEIYYQMGWVCPKCGSVYSPTTSCCPRCTKPYEVTCTYGRTYTTSTGE